MKIVQFLLVPIAVLLMVFCGVVIQMSFENDEDLAHSDADEELLKALQDDGDDGEIRIDAIRSLRMMIEEGYSFGEFDRERLFDELAQIWRSNNPPESRTIPKILLTMNQSRAFEFLTGTEVFHSGHSGLADSLGILNSMELKIPHSVLLPLLVELEKSANIDTRPNPSWPPRERRQHMFKMIDVLDRQRALGRALVSYAINPDDQTEAYLRTTLDRSVEDVRERAAYGLVRLAGIDGALSPLEKLVREKGIEDVTAAQRNIWLVSHYDHYLGGGGHSSYFSQQRSRHFEQLLIALRAIGAERKADAFEKVLKKFGDDGPSQDDVKRAAQIQAIRQATPGEQLPFRDLDQESYQAKENIETLSWLYIADRRNEFVFTDDN